jgi:hypothetical protein
MWWAFPRQNASIENGAALSRHISASFGPTANGSKSRSIGYPWEFTIPICLRAIPLVSNTCR